MAINKGFIKDLQGNHLLPITRGELVLDKDGNIALNSEHFLAGVNGSKYGLITAAEREMLTGGGNGGSLSDLYTKLGYINEGLTIGEKTYSFYDASGVATPITITGTENQITIATNVNNNNIQLLLAEINKDAIAVDSGVVKGITVDKQGRVTSVTASALTNADIPSELSAKKLTGCTTEAVDANEKYAIVNKEYVDTKFNEANSVATGALKFGGTIADLDAAKGVTVNKKTYYYYKVVASQAFTIPGDYTTDGKAVTVRAGDTLIVDADNKLVHVPSGDDITTLTVIKTSADGATSNVINQQFGNLTLKFSPIFSIEGVEGNDKIATITIPPVSSTTDGYLSASDYKKFSSYAENLATTYISSLLDTTPGLYTLGKISFGQSEYEVKGINTTYAVDLIDETIVEGQAKKHNPKVQFSENGSVVTSITYEGANGITVTKEGNGLKFSQKENLSTTPNYLTIPSGENNNQFTINIGTFDENNNIVEGLTSFTQFGGFVKKVVQQIEAITDTLIPQEGDDGTKYRYGNAKLKAAITLDTI